MADGNSGGSLTAQQIEWTARFTGIDTLAAGGKPGGSPVASNGQAPAPGAPGSAAPGGSAPSGPAPGGPAPGGVTGLKIADLASNFDAADKGCAKIDALVAAHPTAPEVIAARKDIEAKFQVIINGGEKAYKSLDQVFDELTKNAGFFSKPDPTAMQHIRDEYGEAIKYFGNTARLARDGHYREANAELHQGHTGIQIAAIDLDGLIKTQIRNAELMITALNDIQVGCQVLLAILSGGLEGVAVKAGVALIGEGIDLAKLGASKLWGVQSEVTLPQIGVHAVIDLVTFGLGQRFEAVDEDLKPFLDTELKKCAPMVKEYVMEKLEKAVIAAMQTFVTKSVDKAFQEKKSEKATPMEFAMEILQDAAHDYARDGFTETVGLLIKEYGSH